LQSVASQGSAIISNLFSIIEHYGVDDATDFKLLKALTRYRSWKKGLIILGIEIEKQTLSSSPAAGHNDDDEKLHYLTHSNHR